MWVDTLYTSVPVRLRVRLSFVLNALLTWVRCLQEIKENPISYQVKSHGRLNRAQPLSPGSCSRMAWMRPNTAGLILCTVLNVHREYIFCITGTQDYCEIWTTFLTQAGRQFCKQAKVPDSNDHAICMMCFVLNHGNLSQLNLPVLEVFLWTSKRKRILMLS